jgi:hypothetical protein
MKATSKHVRVSGALLLAALAGGCAADSADQLFVLPGRYDYSSCAEVATAMTNVTARQQELQTLTERAERESFGVVMATMSYRGDQLRLEGEQKMLAEVARKKNCPAATPVPAAAAAPARRR